MGFHRWPNNKTMSWLFKLFYIKNEIFWLRAETTTTGSLSLTHRSTSWNHWECFKLEKNCYQTSAFSANFWQNNICRGNSDAYRGFQQQMLYSLRLCWRGIPISQFYDPLYQFHTAPGPQYRCYSNVLDRQLCGCCCCTNFLVGRGQELSVK